MENWKTIEGFNSYEVSDLGRVRRSLKGGNPGRAGYPGVVGKILTPGVRTDERLIVVLRQDGKSHSKLLSRLVATAFIPNPLGLPEVNHKKDKSDNRASQLEWKTKAGNERYAVKQHQKGTGVKYDKRRNHWIAQFTHNYKTVYIGSYPTKKDAIAARQKAVKALPEVL